MNFKRINITGLLMLIGIALGFSSCADSKPAGKISSSGKTCEMIVVMNDALWEGLPGDTVRSVFAAPQPGLPQDEPWMSIVQMNTSGFSDLFQKHRILLFFEVDPDLQGAKTDARKDVWSQPQIVIQMKAPNVEMLAAEFGSKSEQIFKLVREAEYRRLLKAYQNAPARASEQKVRSRFGIELNIPLGYNVVVDKPDFIWMKRDAGKYDQGIFVYTRPYVSLNQFDDNYLVELRDSVTSKYVPGPLEGESRMAVERRFPPISRITRLNGNYSKELRGEWMVTRDNMGGPFINYTIVDTLNNQLICLDGYVYNPGGDKRDALIHVEGVFHSVRLAAEPKQN